jgi:hypothetical protein
MPLRHRLGAEILQNLELAAERRYWEGITLASEGFSTAGVYLLGYAGEMFLKFAYFRSSGIRLGDPVTFGPASKFAKTYIPTVGSDHFHSLWYWAHLLRKRRRLLGNPLPPAIDNQLLRRARRLHQNWCVELRYSPIIAAADELSAVYNDITWLRDHRLKLWS